MKTKLSLLISWTIIFSFTGCDNDDEKNNISLGTSIFTFKAPDVNTGGRSADIAVPAFVSYSLKKSNGEIISSKIELYQFADGYTTLPQQLHTGHYTVEQYLVLDADNITIYAAPVAGSPVAELVEHPLPLSFDISSEQTSYISPEVIAVEDHAPADFGYVEFSLSVTAKRVKFILPVQSDQRDKYRSAKLKVTQGSYSRSVTFSGSPQSQLSASVILKLNRPVDIVIVVDADNVYNIPYPPHSGWPHHVSLRSSSSQFEFRQQIAEITNDVFTTPQFNHKIGMGWDFSSAILKATGENGSYIQVKFKKEGLCSDQIKIESNVSEFPNPANGAFQMVDKIVWTQFDPAYDRDYIIEGVNGFYNSPAVQEGEFWSISPDWHQESYVKFVPACEGNDWKFLDSYVRIQTSRNNALNYLNVYFWLERDETESSSIGKSRPLNNDPDFSFR